MLVEMIRIIEKINEMNGIILMGDERMSKEQNLLEALTFIEDHIEEDLSLYDLAQVVGYSVPHFFRLFKRLTGDTVGEYIERRRITKAAIELRNSSKSIGELAFQFGFESHDVFTRAFRRVYGMTPSKYRNASIPLSPLKQLTISNHEKVCDNEEQMTFSTREMKSFFVIGMRCNAITWDADGAIGRLWCEFLNRVNEIKGLSNPIVMYGICECEIGIDKEHFTYMAAIGVDQVEEVPFGMSVKKIRAQKFFQASVPQEISIPEAYTSAIHYAQSLSYHIDDYSEIEVYADSFEDPDISRFKLLIPIK